MESSKLASPIDDVSAERDYSWTAIIAAIRLYAQTRSPSEAAGVNEWADLLEGIWQLKGED